LSLLTHPKTSPLSIACNEWLEAILAARDEVMVPEIVDYEVRREYIRRTNLQSLRKLTNLYSHIIYEPITTEAMREAADLWAWARNSGHITAPMHDLNADVILAAQVRVAATEAEAKIIATTNVRHLAPFADARLWRDIP
jgi:predicted nucleic acid-binding protein